MQIKVNVSGLERTKKAITSLSDFQGLMAIVATLIHRQTTNRIRSTKKSPDGKLWAMRKTGGDWGLLVKTGRLLGSIQLSSTNTEARVGTPLYYAPFLQFGTRKMVARPFLGIGKPDEDELVKAVQAFIAGKIGK